MSVLEPTGLGQCRVDPRPCLIDVTQAGQRRGEISEHSNVGIGSQSRTDAAPRIRKALAAFQESAGGNEITTKGVAQAAQAATL